MRRKLTYIKICLLFFSLFQFLQTGIVQAQLFENFKAYFLPKYNEWILSDSVRIYNPDNLYDYIDGAADSYLGYEFEALLVTTYDGSDKKYITVEIYKHKTPVHAFGIYSLERPQRGNYKKIGAQGYQAEGILNFLCDQFYVKISCHDKSQTTSATITNIANDLAQKLNPKAAMPKMLSYFPAEGKIENSETFVNYNFLGYEFLNSAYLASFGEAENTFRIFIIESRSFDDAKKMLISYMAFAKQTFNESEGQYVVKDPYNGEIKLEWKGKYIWGILNDKNIGITKDYMQLTKDRLASYQAF